MDADGRSGGAAKICVKVLPGDWETPMLAILDTGAEWSVLKTEIADELSRLRIHYGADASARDRALSRMKATKSNDPDRVEKHVSSEVWRKGEAERRRYQAHPEIEGAVRGKGVGSER